MMSRLTDLLDMEMRRVFLLKRTPTIYSLVELMKLTDLVLIRSPLLSQLTLKCPILRYLNSLSLVSRLRSVLMISACFFSSAKSIFLSFRSL